MTFPHLNGPTPRLGRLLCLSTPTPGGPACGTPATWHIAWWLTPKADFSLVCDEHMAAVQRTLVYVDRHPAAISCDMPGTGWLVAEPSRCVPATTEDTAAQQARAES